MEMQRGVDTEAQIDLVPAAPHLALGQQPVRQRHGLLFQHSGTDGRRDGGDGLKSSRALYQQLAQVEGLTDSLDGGLRGDCDDPGAL